MMRSGRCGGKCLNAGTGSGVRHRRRRATDVLVGRSDKAARGNPVAVYWADRTRTPVPHWQPGASSSGYRVAAVRSKNRPPPEGKTVERKTEFDPASLTLERCWNCSY
jgi:hypothetical protein